MAVLLLISAPFTLLSPCLFLDRVLLPLDLLPVVGPFREHPEFFPEWPGRPKNPLLDPLQQYWPWRKYACLWLLKGEVPLWNPHAFSGYPFLANLQSAILYLPNILFLPFAALGCVERGFAWSALLHLLVGGLFSFVLLRRWRLSPPAALLGASAFTFSGWRMAWLEYPTVSLWVVSWLPACLLAIFEVIVRGRVWLWGLLFALFVALTILGGHLQMAAYVFFISLCYAIFEAIRTKALSRLLPLFGGLGLGFLFSLSQVLPTLELLNLSPRAGLAPFWEVLKTAVPLTEAGRLFSPDLSGNPADYNYFGPFNYLETCGYAGALTILLAFFAPRRRRAPLVWFLLGLDFFLLLCAFGTLFYFPLWFALPGATAPGRLFAVHPFLLGALAGLGLDEATRLREGRVALWRAIGATVIAVLAISLTLGEHIDTILSLDLSGYVRKRVLVTASVWAIGCGAIALCKFGRRLRPLGLWLPPLVLIADLLSLGARFNPMPPFSYARAEPSCTLFIRPEGGVRSRSISVGTNFLDWFAPNLPMIWGLFDANGSDSLVPGRYVRLLEEFKGEENRGRPWMLRKFREKLLDALNVRYVLSAIPLSFGGLEFVSFSDMWVYRRPMASPRAYFSRRVWAFSSAEALKNWLLTEGPLGREAAFLGRVAASTGRGEAKVVRYQPNLVKIRYLTPTGGVLVLCDAYFPGWMCYVNEKRKPVLVANLLTRAVEVSKGQGRAVFVYHPGVFSVGCFVALLALSVAVGLLASRLRG